NGTTPMEKAANVQRYVDMGYSEEEASVTFGVTTQTIKNLLALLDCDKTVQKAVTDGKIPASLAFQHFKSMPREEQKEALEKLVTNGTTKGAQAVENIKRIKKGKAAKTKEKAPRMRPRKEIGKAIRVLGKVSHRDADAVIAGLKYALGSDNAFGKEFAKIEAALFPEGEE